MLNKRNKGLSLSVAEFHVSIVKKKRTLSSSCAVLKRNKKLKPCVVVRTNSIFTPESCQFVQGYFPNNVVASCRIRSLVPTNRANHCKATINYQMLPLPKKEKEKLSNPTKKCPIPASMHKAKAFLKLGVHQTFEQTQTKKNRKSWCSSKIKKAT